MGKLCLCLALVSPIWSFVPASAAADPVHIDFDVTVRATHGAMDEIFDLPIQAGDVLHGTLAYVPTLADGNPDPIYGGYPASGTIAIHYGSGVELPLQIMTVISSAWGRGYPNDYFAAASELGNVPGFSQPFAATEFLGPPGIRATDHLATTASEFRRSYFSGGSFQFSANKNGVEPPWDDTTHALFGTLSLASQATAVPEPATLLLIGTGAIGLAARIRRWGRVS